MPLRAITETNSSPFKSFLYKVSSRETALYFPNLIPLLSARVYRPELHGIEMPLKYSHWLEHKVLVIREENFRSRSWSHVPSIDEIRM